MSKSDFLSWDTDLDLDALLGDYTDYDDNCDSNDDEDLQTCQKSKVDTGTPLYKCPACNKELKTISGFRGHVQKQHGLSVKASEHKTDNPKSMPIPRKSSLVFDEENFSGAFDSALKTTLINIRNDPFIDERDAIVKCCETATDSAEMRQRLCSMFSTIFLNQVCDISISADREQLFRRLHQKRTDSRILEDFQSLLTRVTLDNIRLFIQLIFEDIVGELLAEQLKIATEHSNKSQGDITENDQCILYYIAGYIVRSLRKKYSRSPKFPYLNCLTSSAVGSNFVRKYDKWYKIQSRGGLQKPSDEFFLLVRELETIARKNVKVNLDATALLVSPLKESMMESFMVKYYCNKCHETFPSEVLEDIIHLFLTIRGFAIVRVERNKMARSTKTESKKSAGLRQSLRDMKRM